MTKALTDKTMVVMLKGNYKCWLTKKQADFLKNALLKGKKFIQIDEYFFKGEDISFILPASEIDREDRIKRGEWMCEYGEWHQKGEQCGHGLLGR